jgi:hypothetical protein
MVVACSYRVQLVARNVVARNVVARNVVARDFSCANAARPRA